ncbi:excinuclease ABC subunit UvrB [Maridesulfovibrio hydrothermalis]|uniref:UvrABC system protein B n=1 Tax=Maridesulfovibrio hydrothermalis AM13 = DSM 14728 TaxID=1121451 RepID=L0REJ1_9BACT|nr:excinuclease ABC subunit UvrB [Maridesulfovibrio hydrothermalis]CCO24610.1 excinuclease ABC (subunit B) [Maridesulfovibrio hydrothermalis AM13 = DSM 14728]
MSAKFELVSDYTLKGDQPQAVKELVDNIKHGVQDQVLLGATGTGKTFAIANVVQQLNRPTLVMAPNKTLAAQLFNEFKALFPHNAVEYFVSYYDYYQPEAYLPHSDTFIEKDSSINDDIDKLRHSATHALLTRRDVLIVASVSCIYGLGSPEFYSKMIIPVEEGQELSMEKLMDCLVEVQYDRNDYDFHRGTFRVRGDVIEIIPAYSREQALRIEFFGDEIDSILETDPLTGEVTGRRRKTVIYPASHFVSDKDNLERAREEIRTELSNTLVRYKKENKLIEAQRIEQRTMYDLEMIEEIGYCSGIENYSRHLDGRKEGDPPATLIHYFPDDFLLFMDESHIAVPQVGAMYNGDRSRKTTLVNFGFRLPSALDNRPLCFDEFLDKIGQTVYVSATPGPWEIERSQGLVVEQIIRPTGLLDPEVEIRPVKGQMDDLLAECKEREKRGERVLITTLTKRMSEDLTDYFNQMGVEAKYLHSDIDTMERMAIIQSLRAGEFTALVGINLLREGLDIPEVSLVAILDADKEGFLRSTRSLIQTFGRAARNSGGKVYLYADRITNSMRTAMDETSRRRLKQMEYNKQHGIIPQTIRKSLDNMLGTLYSDSWSGKEVKIAAEDVAEYGLSPAKMEKEVRKLEKEMRKYAAELEFEKAAELRDRVQVLRERIISLG